MQTAKRCLFILLSVLFTSTLFATKYTFTGSGDWKDASNWEGGIIAPNYLKAADTLIINGDCVNEPKEIDEYNLQDVFGASDGTIIISKGATFTLVNFTQFSHGGRIEIYGTLVNQTAFEAFLTDTIIIHTGGILKNQQGTGYVSFFGNQGYLEVKSGGTIINEWKFDNDMEANAGVMVMYSGSSFTNSGRGTFRPGNLTNHGGSIQNSATLSGDAVVKGNLLNTGTLSPGNSPGTYGVTGNYTAATSTVHNFEVGGLGAGQYDLLKVEGIVNLNGTLNVTLINGFSSASTHEITIITGAIKGNFETVNLPDFYSLVYNDNNVVLKRMPTLMAHFIDTKAVLEDGKQKIHWNVRNESEVTLFEIEESVSGSRYYKIGSVAPSGAGSYSFTSWNNLQFTYYRIKCIYKDKLVSYSDPLPKSFGEQVNLFTGSGNWSDAARWSLGTAPTELTQGKQLVISGNCIFDLNTFRNNGHIEILRGSNLNLSKGDVMNAGTINVWGTLENNANKFENLDSMNVAGIIINNTTFSNKALFMSMFDGSTFINTPTGIYLSGHRLGMNLTSGFINYGTLGGNLSFEGDCLNEAILSPGNSPGTCEVAGNYTATASALHTFEIDGFTPGTYDVLHVNGIANLNGVMNINIKDGLPWNSTTSVPIITGNINGKFINANLPDGFIIEYKSNSVVIKSATALPVQFVSLKAIADNKQVTLQWEVADEKHVKHYEVQKSIHENVFLTIGKVQAASHTHYNFTDLKPESKVLYRVKSIDEDGKQQYSQVVLVKLEELSTKLNATITPSGNKLIATHRTARHQGWIMIYTVDGKLLKKALVQKGSQQTTVDFSFAKAGIYLICYVDNSATAESQKVLKR